MVRRCSSSPRDMELYNFQSLETSLAAPTTNDRFVEFCPWIHFVHVLLPLLDCRSWTSSSYTILNEYPLISTLETYHRSRRVFFLHIHTPLSLRHLGRLSTLTFRGILQALPGVASVTQSAMSPWSIANSPSINLTFSIALSYLFLGRTMLLSVGEDLWYTRVRLSEADAMLCNVSSYTHDQNFG